MRRHSYSALRTKLTAKTDEQMVIPFSSMDPEQRHLVRDIELKRMVDTVGQDRTTGLNAYSRSCARFVGQTAKFSINGEWFSCAPNRFEEGSAESTKQSSEQHHKLRSLWHGRDWTKTLMTRSDARDKNGLALLSFSKFQGLVRPGRMKSQLTDRQSEPTSFCRTSTL